MFNVASCQRHSLIPFPFPFIWLLSNPNMSQGILYGTVHTRTILAVGLIRSFHLDIEVLKKGFPGHIEHFPNGKVPALVAADGLLLQEVIAVLFYLVSLHDPSSPLLGSDIRSKALVLKYLSWGTTEFMRPVTVAADNILGRSSCPYNKRLVDDAVAQINIHVQELEERLIYKTFLVGERITLADLFVATCFYRPFGLLLDSQWRQDHPILMRWFKTVVASPYLSYFFDSFEYATQQASPSTVSLKIEDRNNDGRDPVGAVVKGQGRP